MINRFLAVAVWAFMLSSASAQPTTMAVFKPEMSAQLPAIQPLLDAKQPVAAIVKGDQVAAFTLGQPSVQASVFRLDDQHKPAAAIATLPAQLADELKQHLAKADLDSAHAAIQAFFDGAAKAQTQASPAKPVSAIPADRDPEYLAKTPDGETIYIDAPSSIGGRSAEEWYRAHAVYIGQPGRMKRFGVTRFSRMRDGGTTHIDSEAGRFYFAAPQRDEPATWTRPDGRQTQLEKLSPEISAILALGVY